MDTLDLRLRTLVCACRIGCAGTPVNRVRRAEYVRFELDFPSRAVPCNDLDRVAIRKASVSKTAIPDGQPKGPQ
jgi:hypothetical protein